MNAKDIIGKRVIDIKGNELGDVSDIELDWENKAIIALFLEKTERLAEEVIDKIAQTLKIGKDGPSIRIPVDRVTAMGTVIIVTL